MEMSPLLLQSINDGLADIRSINLEAKSKKKMGQYEALACTTIKLSF
jgi:DNA-dependent protein kinase catalytic subunit